MYTNLTAYKFIEIPSSSLPDLRESLRQRCETYVLKGTILLGTEGINFFLAGEPASIDKMRDFFDHHPLFYGLSYKYSESDFIPFKKLAVKVRKEIVTFGQAQIRPTKNPAPYLSPLQLKQWYEEDKKFIILDTRNTFEFDIGSFKNAVHLNIEHFRDFPKAVQRTQLDPNLPIVTFCTGGIRCEKAAPYLISQGFKKVYQLEGGILNYFEQCGSACFKGRCFVFDDRITLKATRSSLS